jgi:hypothetical protein
MLGLAAAFFVGVLVGSGLHTFRIDQRYQRLARLVRHFNELNSAQEMTQGIKPEQYSSSRFVSVR